MERVLIAEGGDDGCFDIECAVRSNLTSPVATFLEELAAGQSEVASGLPADEQVGWLEWFVSACELIASTGEPPQGRTYNQLESGIWEIKHIDLRVSFYDTDGTGEYSPTEDRDSYASNELRPWPDDFEQFLRLTSAFKKTGQKTNQRQINFARMVRREDLDHDRKDRGTSVAR